MNLGNDAIPDFENSDSLPHHQASCTSMIKNNHNCHICEPEAKDSLHSHTKLDKCLKDDCKVRSLIDISSGINSFGKNEKVYLPIINTSDSNISFKIKAKDKCFDIEPKIGFVPINQQSVIKVHFNTKRLEKVKHKFIIAACRITPDQSIDVNSLKSVWKSLDENKIEQTLQVNSIIENKTIKFVNYETFNYGVCEGTTPWYQSDEKKLIINNFLPISSDNSPNNLEDCSDNSSCNMNGDANNEHSKTILSKSIEHPDAAESMFTNFNMPVKVISSDPGVSSATNKDCESQLVNNIDKPQSILKHIDHSNIQKKESTGGVSTEYGSELNPILKDRNIQEHFDFSNIQKQVSNFKSGDRVFSNRNISPVNTDDDNLMQDQHLENWPQNEALQKCPIKSVVSEDNLSKDRIKILKESEKKYNTLKLDAEIKPTMGKPPIEKCKYELKSLELKNSYTVRSPALNTNPRFNDVENNFLAPAEALSEQQTWRSSTTSKEQGNNLNLEDEKYFSISIQPAGDSIHSIWNNIISPSVNYEDKLAASDEFLDEVALAIKGPDDYDTSLLKHMNHEYLKSKDKDFSRKSAVENEINKTENMFFSRSLQAGDIVPSMWNLLKLSWSKISAEPIKDCDLIDTMNKSKETCHESESFKSLYSSPDSDEASSDEASLCRTNSYYSIVDKSDDRMINCSVSPDGTVDINDDDLIYMSRAFVDIGERTQNLLNNAELTHMLVKGVLSLMLCMMIIIILLILLQPEVHVPVLPQSMFSISYDAIMGYFN